MTRRIWTAAAFAGILRAQVQVSEPASQLPPSFRPDLKGVPEVKLPPYDRSPEEGLQLHSMGKRRDLPADAFKQGKWIRLPDGSKLWRLAIVSPGASSIRVHFNAFQVGLGQVWVHNGKAMGGPYTRNGPFNSGDFWSHAIPGDRVIIEFSGEPRSGEVPFKSPEISHRYAE